MAFFEDGTLSKAIGYVNGVTDGKITTYWENGQLKLVGFFYKGKPMGDTYFYDTSGRLYLYNFLNFENKSLTVRKYDSGGVASGQREYDFYLYDSVAVFKGKNGADTVTTLLLITHQPKMSMKTRIDNVSKGGKVLFSKQIGDDDRIVFYNNVISSEVDSIKVIGIRYDSVLKESRTFMIVRLVKDL